MLGLRSLCQKASSRAMQGRSFVTASSVVLHPMGFARGRSVMRGVVRAPTAQPAFLASRCSPLTAQTNMRANARHLLLGSNSMGSPVMQSVRFMNRNARRPKKANHGKRPCSRMRRRAKAATIKSRAHRTKVYGSY